MSWVLRVMVPGRGEGASLPHDGGGWELVAGKFFAECVKVWATDKTVDPYGVVETWFVPHLFLWVGDENRDSVRVLCVSSMENRVIYQEGQ